jgi:hypothetical protein
MIVLRLSPALRCVDYNSPNNPSIVGILEEP